MKAMVVLPCMQLTDKYGSPTLEDLQNVAAAVNARVLEQLGEDAAGEIEVAVSSPVRRPCLHYSIFQGAASSAPWFRHPSL